MSLLANNFLLDKLKAYKRKYYTNKFIRGVIFSFAALMATYVVYSSVEFIFWLNSPLRAILFFSFIVLAFVLIYIWVLSPLIKILFPKKQLSNEEAARQIGLFFPGIDDKLLNTLQLQSIDDSNNALIAASIEQKAFSISDVPFVDAIRISENRKHLKYVFIPLILIISLLYLAPQLFSESNNRIVNFSEEFVPLAPFSFELQNNSLKAFRNEDFIIDLFIHGSVLPDQVYIDLAGRKVKMNNKSSRHFSYTLTKIQKQTTFNFYSAGFSSKKHQIDVVARPNLKGFDIVLNYPSYLKKTRATLKNTGSFQVPEGTTVEWVFYSVDADSLMVAFNEETPITANKKSQELHNLTRTIKNDTEYEIKLANQYSRNKDKIAYSIRSIKDEYPKINISQFQDTTLYSFIILGGNIGDDHGVTGLKLFYRLKSTEKALGFSSLAIAFDPKQNNQSFFHEWNLNTFDLKEGEQVEYFVKVWDNDGVNGRKSSSTNIYTFEVPSKKKFKNALESISQSTENQIDKSFEESKELIKEIKKAEEKLKSKPNREWQDEKMLKDILEHRKKLEEELEKIKSLNESLTKKNDRFNERSERIKKKSDQLQQLMEELLDEETKKLYEELQQLLDQKSSTDQINDLLDKLEKKESDLENELERALELFKKLKIEQKIEDTIQELQDTAENQDKLSEETLDKDKLIDDLQNKQQELNDKFEEIKNDVDEMKDMNQDLKSPQSLPDTSTEEEETDQQQEESKESLEKNKRKAASKAQKKASDEMKKMAAKLQQMQNSEELEGLSENMEQLREIVDNLIKLSFDQESVMKEFREVHQSDPRFITLSQGQLKLRDDAKVIQDSLLALANRVFQIQSFVTREVTEMNKSMDDAMESIRDRNKSQASAKQQFAMTSMNNLALLLDDILEQMQQQMADATGKPKKGGQKKNLPGLSDLQKQLNKNINNLKKSGKSGRALSEELAKMAAQQERLRKMLQEIQEGSEGEKKGAGLGGDEIMEQMEQTELDLVNKKITQETINRQKDIESRLLEFENAMRERELDDERKGETGKEYENDIPKEFEEYFKTKEKEIELLKTVPPKLNPYYKKEVSDYFNRISNF